MKDFIVEFSLEDDEYFTALRLIAGAICSVKDVDIDALEDFKVCVTESALMLKNSGFATLKAVFAAERGVRCDLRGLGGEPVRADNDLSLALVGALVSDCEIEEVQPGIVGKVSLVL